MISFDRYKPWQMRKLNFNPNESSERKTITLKVEHIQREEVVELKDIPYKIPDLLTWATSTTYLVLRLDAFTLPYEGEYAFGLWVDGEYKNQETVTVVMTKGEAL